MSEGTEKAGLSAEEREGLRKSARKQKANTINQAAAEKAGKVSDVFPVGKAYSVDGIDYEIGPLTFRDQRDIEHEYFNLQEFFTELDAGRVTAMLFLVWLSFRKSDPSLSLDGMLAFIAGSDLDLTELANEAIQRTGLMKATEEADPNEPGGEA